MKVPLLPVGLFCFTITITFNKKLILAPKRLLLYILLTNLICIFPAGHAILFLGLYEPILIAGAISGNMESPAMWMSSAILLVLGQLVIILALIQQIEQRRNQLGLIGIAILTLATLSVYFAIHEQVWTITLFTSVPFIILSWMFLKKTLLK